MESKAIRCMKTGQALSFLMRQTFVFDIIMNKLFDILMKKWENIGFVPGSQKINLLKRKVGNKWSKNT